MYLSPAKRVETTDYFPSDIELLTKNQTMKKSSVILQLDSYGVFQNSLPFIAFEIPDGQERIILPLIN